MARPAAAGAGLPRSADLLNGVCRLQAALSQWQAQVLRRGAVAARERACDAPLPLDQDECWADVVDQLRAAARRLRRAAELAESLAEREGGRAAHAASAGARAAPSGAAAPRSPSSCTPLSPASSDAACAARCCALSPSCDCALSGPSADEAGGGTQGSEDGSALRSRLVASEAAARELQRQLDAARERVRAERQQQQRGASSSPARAASPRAARYRAALAARAAAASPGQGAPDEGAERLRRYRQRQRRRVSPRSPADRRRTPLTSPSPPSARNTGLVPPPPLRCGSLSPSDRSSAGGHLSTACPPAAWPPVPPRGAGREVLLLYAARCHALLRCLSGADEAAVGFDTCIDTASLRAWSAEQLEHRAWSLAHFASRAPRRLRQALGIPDAVVLPAAGPPPAHSAPQPAGAAVEQADTPQPGPAEDAEEAPVDPAYGLTLSALFDGSWAD
eukprot:TRINITY_DN8137_c1_g1_i1.p1 TRINITY_DN8137_c1_g1~~TRINITY_DN8137_c1_g1_i1.p1  ORF type:complete len:472 (+),score=113.70 TRINITY_DN8137_c1_g1_i1:68-1417(+)